MMHQPLGVSRESHTDSSPRDHSEPIPQTPTHRLRGQNRRRPLRRETACQTYRSSACQESANHRRPRALTCLGGCPFPSRAELAAYRSDTTDDSMASCAARTQRRPRYAPPLSLELNTRRISRRRAVCLSFEPYGHALLASAFASADSCSLCERDLPSTRAFRRMRPSLSSSAPPWTCPTEYSWFGADSSRS